MLQMNYSECVCVWGFRMCHDTDEFHNVRLNCFDFRAVYNSVVYGMRKTCLN